MERFGSKRTRIFFIIESIIYIVFLTLDIARQGFFLSGFFKYLGILLCAGYVWRARTVKSSWKHKCFKWSYVFLLIADIFLLFTEYYLLGLLAFLCVQGCYSYFLNYGEKNIVIFQIVCCLGLSILILILLSLCKIELDFVLIAATFYIVLFLYNIQKAISKYQLEKESICFMIGIILYFLCDINVGIFQASGYFSWEKISQLVGIARIGMWFFYLPGQVLIAYSAVSEK